MSQHPPDHDPPPTLQYGRAEEPTPPSVVFGGLLIEEHEKWSGAKRPVFNMADLAALPCESPGQAVSAG